MFTITTGFANEKPVSIANMSEYEMYNGTEIIRFDDTDKNITCYINRPKYMTTSSKCSTIKYPIPLTGKIGTKESCVDVYDGNNAGSISCVKM